MEKRIRKVVYSSAFYKDSQNIYLYGKETFGKMFADIFVEELHHITEVLSFQFNLHPECRYIPTKTKKYSNIILGKYLVVYRITSDTIEVIRAFHSSQSISKIKKQQV